MMLQGLTREQSNGLYIEALESNDTEALRKLCREDLFFLLTIALKRKDINRDWLYERIREVEASPNGHLDLWAREHYKSTIITFGLTIQDILKDPEDTFGIFSHTRPIAKDFLNQIKRELENNTFLKGLFPDILYQEPQKEATKWSLDGGIIVKRKTNPKEATVEAWGLVDGQPTGKHFKKRLYDDTVTRESVSTPEQIKKTTEAWEMSINLGAIGGFARYIGTRYHMSDSYDAMMKRGSVKPRIYTATDDGTMSGNPVLLTQEQLDEKRRDMGPYTFGTQMLQNPIADNAMGFKKEWLRHYKTLKDTAKWNKYLLVDPASAKKKSSDYTVMMVIGLAPDGNRYLLDAIRDRLNLTERASKLFEFHRKWNPKAVGYEKYGMQADIEHMKYVMEQENYRFDIVELGGAMAKEDRIRRLVPIFEQGGFYLPEFLYFVNYEGRRVDFIQAFINDEYLAFPVSGHDDMLDTGARITDEALGAKFPKIQSSSNDDYETSSGSWLG